MLIMHQIAQRDGFKNAIKSGLKVFPGLSDLAPIKTCAVAGIFHAICQFYAAFHQLDDAAKGEFLRLAQKNMAAFGAAYAPRNARQAQLAQNLFAELGANAGLRGQLAG